MTPEHWQHFTIESEYGWPAEINIVCSHPGHDPGDIKGRYILMDSPDAVDATVPLVEAIRKVEAHWAEHHDPDSVEIRHEERRP